MKKIRAKKRPSTIPSEHWSDTEQSVEVTVWMGDGFCGSYPGGDSSWPELSIGRTDSKQALGFIIHDQERKAITAFVLNREQLKHLIPYFQGQLRRLKKGKKR
jgi:hypothetical protein